VTVLDPADALAILQLAVLADTRATQRDAVAYAALFTEDAVMDGDMGQVIGRDALAETVARIWDAEPPERLHLTCNALIDESASTPAVTSILLLVTPQITGLGAQVANVFQRFRQTPAGWRISERHITMRPTAAPAASPEGSP
jgi:ketosteroid isomerase-like protein